MRAKRLFENPDTCCRSGRYDTYSECEDSYEYALKYYDDDSHAFGYYSDMMVFGPEGVFHPVLAVGGRQDFKYAGRIWIKQKLISFWDYPPPNKILQTLKDLEEAFANATCLYLDQIKEPNSLVGSEGDQDFYFNEPKEINILKDRDYRIEVMKGTPDQKKFGKKDWPSEVGDTEFITLNNYALRKNVHDRPKGELGMEHGISPLKKKKQKVPAGTGSRRYGAKKPLEQRQREMTSESLGFKRGIEPKEALEIGSISQKKAWMTPEQREDYDITEFVREKIIDGLKDTEYEAFINIGNFGPGHIEIDFQEEEYMIWIDDTESVRSAGNVWMYPMGLEGEDPELRPDWLLGNYKTRPDKIASILIQVYGKLSTEPEVMREGIDFKRGQDPSRALSIGMDDEAWIEETVRRLKEDLNINVYRDDYVHEESGMMGSDLFFYDKGLTLEYFDHAWYLHLSPKGSSTIHLSPMPVLKSDNLDEAIIKTKKFMEIYKSEENNKELIQKMQKQRWDYDSQNLPPT